MTNRCRAGTIGVILLGLLAACGSDEGPDDNPPPGGAFFTVLGGGNNVPERYTSDLWVHGEYAYTGTWGSRSAQGNVLKVWHLGAGGAPTIVDSVVTAGIGTVSDVEVSSDGSLLVFSGENGSGSGLFLYSLADPANPVFIDSAHVGTGLHTATFGYIDGKRYIFAAKNPSSPALMIFEIDPAAGNPIALVTWVPVAANYGIHDTFVRDGIAFVCAWNTGILIYDVGDGIKGGSALAPMLVSSIATVGGQAHNAWWFHNPPICRGSTFSSVRRGQAQLAVRRTATSTWLMSRIWRIRPRSRPTT
jgi:hypothetical protein